jgi:hypothetical protein
VITSKLHDSNSRVAWVANSRFDESSGKTRQAEHPDQGHRMNETKSLQVVIELTEKTTKTQEHTGANARAQNQEERQMECEPDCTHSD